MLGASILFVRLVFVGVMVLETDFGVKLFKSEDNEGYLGWALVGGGSFEIFKAPELTAAIDLGDGDGVTRKPLSRSGYSTSSLGVALKTARGSLGALALGLVTR